MRRRADPDHRVLLADREKRYIFDKLFSQNLVWIGIFSGLVFKVFKFFKVLFSKIFNTGQSSVEHVISTQAFHIENIFISFTGKKSFSNKTVIHVRTRSR